MAVGLKTKGIETLTDLRRRIGRQYALQRISRPDRDNLITMVDALEAYIIKMSEKSPEIEEYEENQW